jgi:heme-degrading monooxygenase HmoA
MIVREFHATVEPGNAKKYYAFFRDTLTLELRKIPGHRGALVLSRASGETTHITVLTFWESEDSVRRFAGDTPNKAVIEPEARAILSSFDDHVTQHTVALDTTGHTSRSDSVIES